VRCARDQVDPTLYFGLAGDVTALRLVGGPEDVAVPLALLGERVTPVGWPAPLEPGGDPEPMTDVVLGSAGITMAALWAGGDTSEAVVAAGAQAMIDTADERPTGLEWPMQVGKPVAERSRMPNYSHGTAGVAAALAVAGEQLGRTDLVAAAVRGAEHLVAIADLSGDGCLVPTLDPQRDQDVEPVTFTWCHGPAGTSHLFTALAHAGVETVRDVPVVDWRRRCLHSVMTSGIPQRLRPGFWDNDGRCCGTAGVADVILDAAQAADDPDEAARYLAFARVLGDALLERAVRDHEGSVCWRFTEHRKDPSLLDPGVGWMQGAIGIGALLLRLARVLDDGLDAPVADRPDSWWSVPERLRTSATHS
jgi:lantibiotic modifying enzyme